MDETWLCLNDCSYVNPLRTLQTIGFSTFLYHLLFFVCVCFVIIIFFHSPMNHRVGAFNHTFCKIICHLFMEVFLIIYKGFFGKIKLSKNSKRGMWLNSYMVDFLNLVKKYVMIFLCFKGDLCCEYVNRQNNCTYNYDSTQTFYYHSSFGYCSWMIKKYMNNWFSAHIRISSVSEITYNIQEKTICFIHNSISYRTT